MAQLYFDRLADMREVAEAFRQQGVVVVRQLIQPEVLQAMREWTRGAVYARARSVGISLADDLDLDTAFNQMCAVDRSLGGDIYGALRYHPEAMKLLSDPVLIQYLELFLGTRHVYYAVDQTHFRIDRKGEERFSLPWHQDYWWNNTSKTAVTVWYSFVDVPPELGPMKFLLGSHHGVAKIKVDPTFKQQWDQNKLFHLAEPVDESQAVEVPVEAGDVVFLHALALHRSGVNVSERNRWSIVTRFADMYDPAFVAKGWKSGIRVGYLSLLDTDPECVVNRHEIVG